MAQGCNSSSSILDSDLHSHITGVDCLRGHKTGTDSLLKLLTSGRLSGKVALITGPRSSGKTAMAVAVARELAKLAIPALAMDVTEVFSRVPRDGELTSELTPTFASNLLRAVAIKTSDGEHLLTTLHWVSEELKMIMNSPEELIEVDQFREGEWQTATLVPGVVFITGLVMDCKWEDHYVTFFRQLKEAIFTCGGGQALGLENAAVVVLGTFSNLTFSRNVVGNVGKSFDSYRKPLPLEHLTQFAPIGLLVPDLVDFVFYTVEYTEQEVKEIFLMRARADGASIGKNALEELIEMADKKGLRSEAHRLLDQAIKMAKEKRAANRKSLSFSLSPSDQPLMVINISHLEAARKWEVDRLKVKSEL